MPLQLSITARNSELDAIETAAGASARLRLYTGDPPENCAAAASGTLLCDMPLPPDWMQEANAGMKLKAGVWTAQCIANGHIGHFRLYNNAGSICHAQGTVTASGGGGDMTFDNADVLINQSLVINSFTFKAQNA